MSSEKDFNFENNNFVPPEEDKQVLTISLTGLLNIFKKKKKDTINSDIEKIKEYENFIKNSDERQDL